MKKNDINLNSERVSFSKKIKRKILLEIARGTNASEALLKHAFSSLNEISQDKKYAAKLLHKWRKEMYDHKEILNILHHEVDIEMINEQIQDIGDKDDYEFDSQKALEELKTSFLRSL